MTDPRRIVAIILAVVLAVLVVSFGPAMCNRLQGEKQARKIEGGQARATLNSMDEALATQNAVDNQAIQIDATTKEGRHEIEQAPAGNSNDAADRATCGMRSYAEQPRYRVKCAALRAADSAKSAATNRPR